MMRYRWHVPDGFVGGLLEGGDSHESICITNDTTEDASLALTAYFADRDPASCGGVVVPALRNRHIRTDSAELRALDLRAREPYGLRIESDVPLHIQYSRLDQSPAHTTLMTTGLFRSDGTET